MIANGLAHAAFCSGKYATGDHTILTPQKWQKQEIAAGGPAAAPAVVFLTRRSASRSRVQCAPSNLARKNAVR
jgi:hypothetical protein